jgi:uncharacterized protein YwgA
MTEEKERLAILGYLIKKLSEITTNQIGATSIQKLIYLLNREGVLDYRYTMYHYGPYSGELSYDQNRATQLDLIRVNWIDRQGYDIKSNPKIEDFIKANLPEEKTPLIDKIVAKFGEFHAVDLSLIATAYYVLDNGGADSDSQLIEIVSSIKPDYAMRIPVVLKEAGILPLKKAN